MSKAVVLASCFLKSGFVRNILTLNGPHLTNVSRPLSGLQIPQIDKKKMLEEWKGNLKIDKLSKQQMKIHGSHMKAVEEDQEIYNDPYTGFEVFSIIAHLNRGYCCGNACRHCPFKHMMVEARYKNTKIFNGSFFS